MNGLSFTLTGDLNSGYTGGGTVGACGAPQPLTLTFNCIGNQFNLTLSGRCAVGAGSVTGALVSVSCSPIQIVFAADIAGLCCTGPVTVTITL